MRLEAQTKVSVDRFLKTVLGLVRAQGGIVEKIMDALAWRYRNMVDRSVVEDAVHDAVVSLLAKGLPLATKMVRWGAGHYVGNTIRKYGWTAPLTGFDVDRFSYSVDRTLAVDIVSVLSRLFSDDERSVICGYLLGEYSFAELAALYPSRSSSGWSCWVRDVGIPFLRLGLKDYRSARR